MFSCMTASIRTGRCGSSLRGVGGPPQRRRLLCDNIVDNGSFFDFCASVARHPITSQRRTVTDWKLRFGVIVR